MPDYPYSDNIYSALEDPDVEDQPLELQSQAGLGPVDGNRHTPGRGHDYGYGVGAVGGDDDDDDDDDAYQQHHHEDEVLSPTDGYFGRSGSAPSAGGPAYPSDTHSTPSSRDQVRGAATTTSPSTPGHAAAAAVSSQVPHVPDVWVSDPTIGQGSTAEDKAREAREEEREAASRRHVDTPPPHPPSRTSASHVGGRGGTGASVSSSHTSSQPSSVSGSGYGHPRYGYGPGLSSAGPYAQRYTPLSRPQRSGTIYSERSSLFSEAPPAYTPSPTSVTSVSSFSHDRNINNNNNNSINNNNNNYQTFSSPANMGRISEAESQGLLAGRREQYYRGLEDMGGEQGGNGHDNAARDMRARARRCVPHPTGKTCRLFLLGLVLLFVAAGFLVSYFVSVEDEKKTHRPGNDNPNHKDPGSPPVGKMPIHDGHGTRLAYPAFDGDMLWADDRLCTANQIKYQTQTFDLAFSDAHGLTLLQEVNHDHDHDHNNNNGQEIHITGDIILRRSGPGTPGPSITLEIISNDAQVPQPDITWDHTAQELRIRTPPYHHPWPTHGATAACLQIRATVWAPPRSTVRGLTLEAVHLGVQLLDNLSLRVAGASRISSTAGHVAAATDGEAAADERRRQQLALLRLWEGGSAAAVPPSTFELDSRRVEVRTVSGGIAGSWPLYDYLGLETVSGSVLVGVEPKEVLREEPRAAVLSVRTTSGAVEVYEPVVKAAARGGGGGGGIPAREYEVDVYTMSGTVRGSLAFGKSCKVHTTSGNIDMTLLPVLDRSQISSSSSFTGAGAGEHPLTSILETATTSGTTTINVLDALWKDIQQTTGAHPQQQQNTPPLRALDSRHSTTSAPIRLSYPSAWEGTIEADTLTSGLDVSGRGVDIIRREEEFPGFRKHVLARKGPVGSGGSGGMVCHSMSGGITVEVRS